MSVEAETATALVLTFELSMPAVLAATGAGLVIGILQALTQIQDQTLPHAVKLVAVMLVLAGSAAWMGGELIAFASRQFDLIARSG